MVSDNVKCHVCISVDDASVRRWKGKEEGKLERKVQSQGIKEEESNHIRKENNSTAAEMGMPPAVLLQGTLKRL